MDVKSVKNLNLQLELADLVQLIRSNE
jgi:hypothetical protein